jgi:FtsP/CotA-like multicopper oxidase with cupredoxin domain
LNAANAQNFVLRFSDQRTFHVIASDGGFLPGPVAVTQLTISPAERFEVLVDFANGKAVALETGPDEEMGIFGRLARDGSADYVTVMRFETTTTMPLVKEMPTRLVELSAASQASAVRRRQFIVNSGICMNRTQAGEHADMVALERAPARPTAIAAWLALRSPARCQRSFGRTHRGGHQEATSNQKTSKAGHA